MSTRKMISTPEEIASRHNPTWEVADTGASTGSSAVEADDVSPNLDILRKKFSAPQKASAIKKTIRSSSDAVFSSSRTATTGTASFVRMNLKDPSDSTTRSKTVVVLGGKILGESG